MGIDRILDVKVDVTGRLGACNISMREIIDFSWNDCAAETKCEGSN